MLSFPLLPWAGRCARLFFFSPSLFPCFPLPSLFLFRFVSFVLLLFSFLLLPFWLGCFCGFVCLVFWVLCCPPLCWGFGSFRAASARRVHVVLGICPPVSRPVGGVDGSDSESSVDEADGDVPSDRLYLAVGQHHLIPSFSGGCVASQ